MQTWLIAFLLAGGGAVAAQRAGALASSGAWAAMIVGGVILGGGGLAWAGLLLAFFVSSSALSRMFSRRKQNLSEKFAKGSRRDAGQVLANGGVAAAFSVIHAFIPGAGWVWAAFAGALAAVNADTWATELGVLSRVAPRLITSGQPVPRGTSGGVTWWGLTAALGGSALLGGLAGWFSGDWMAGLGTIGGGWLAALFDSYLGATVQAMYICPVCGQETEHHPWHTCGAETTFLRGWRWMDNDVVNGIAALVGAGLAAVIWILA